MRTINFLDIKGILFIILYLIIFGVVIVVYSSKYSDDKKIKKLFVCGYFFKIMMGIAFALIYDFYYNWEGDTYSYYSNACGLGGLFFSNTKAYFMILFDMIDETNVSTLPQTIGYYPRFAKDASVYAIHRFLSPFAIMGLNNYYVIGICLNTFLFVLNWKFFRFLNQLFPSKANLIAISILFIPSVGFWGAGLLKDSYTLSFTFIFIIYFYRIFFQKKLSIKNILFFLLSIYVVVKLKPYIVYSCLVSCFIWLGFSYIYLVKNKFLRFCVFPIVAFAIGFGGFFVMQKLSAKIGGAYGDIDSMLWKAAASQYDLKQEYYHGASFDIGDLEPTAKGALSIAPAAIIAGFYRPFIWEAKSIVMLLSGIENLVLLLLSVYVLLKGGLKFFFRKLFESPFLIFCFLFSLLMSLGIGLSTSNFGALVRFTIPFLPFFFMFWLFLLNDLRKEKLALKKN
ncbi:hypothetical protein LJC11_00760 [Bacteroidales bacterium OttesenSCG-928-I21]|nr:hypothetical protein [Bacteroidales bacterium OttesenSCG-928-I21]